MAQCVRCRPNAQRDEVDLDPAILVQIVNHSQRRATDHILNGLTVILPLRRGHVDQFQCRRIHPFFLCIEFGAEFIHNTLWHFLFLPVHVLLLFVFLIVVVVVLFDIVVRCFDQESFVIVGDRTLNECIRHRLQHKCTTQTAIDFEARARQIVMAQRILSCHLDLELLVRLLTLGNLPRMRLTFFAQRLVVLVLFDHRPVLPVIRSLEIPVS
mmetsp:Transcript_17217/g.26856  ORF Transcript_17217/g.26856 Transcript_17217/m.26856 type:complete len:212 (-) Transcript_17217:322-957(-)